MTTSKKSSSSRVPTERARRRLPASSCPTREAARFSVNADLIAAGISPFQHDSAAFRAGRLMLQEIARHAAHGVSFGFETTLSGLSYARMIGDWRANGYTVRLIFLSLGSVDEAIARVATRVRQGGHDVPVDTIRRRFDAGRLNFQSIYRSRVDSWLLFDNSGEMPLLMEEGDNT